MNNLEFNKQDNVWVAEFESNSANILFVGKFAEAGATVKVRYNVEDTIIDTDSFFVSGTAGAKLLATGCGITVSLVTDKEPTYAAYAFDDANSAAIDEIIGFVDEVEELLKESNNTLDSINTTSNEINVTTKDTNEDVKTFKSAVDQHEANSLQELKSLVSGITTCNETVNNIKTAVDNIDLDATTQIERLDTVITNQGSNGAKIDSVTSAVQQVNSSILTLGTKLDQTKEVIQDVDDTVVRIHSFMNPTHLVKLEAGETQFAQVAVLKNITDTNVKVKVKPEHAEDYIETVLYPGWNPEVVIAVNDVPADTLQYGY